MTDDQIIELSKQLIAIESTGKNPDGLRQAHDFIKDLVKKHAAGKDVTVEEFFSNGISSLLAYKGKVRPEKFHVILNGHLDVVDGKPEQYKAVVKDGKLFGRGAHDEKPACIVIADIFCRLVDKVPFTLGLQMVTDEEVGGHNGALYQVKQGVRTDFVICVECGRSPNVYEIANETKGIIFAEIEFTGKTAHGGYPWRGDNAATKAINFAKAVHARYPTPADESHGTTVTVTSIVSDPGVHNKIPEHAFVKLDIRYAAKDDRFATKKATTQLLKQLDPAVASIKFPAFSVPMYADPNGAFVQKLKKVAEEVEGKTFKLVTRHAGSDGRHFIRVGGQACEFGIAGEDQHGDNEHVSLTAITNFRRTIERFLTTLDEK